MYLYLSCMYYIHIDVFIYSSSHIFLYISVISNSSKRMQDAYLLITGTYSFHRERECISIAVFREQRHVHHIGNDDAFICRLDQISLCINNLTQIIFWLLVWRLVGRSLCHNTSCTYMLLSEQLLLSIVFVKSHQLL